MLKTISEQAAHYVVRAYSGEMSSQEEQEFNLWIAQNNEHKEEYRLQLALFEQRAENLLISSRPQWKLYTSIAASLFLIAMLVMRHWGDIHDSPPLVYQTLVGEQKEITLQDGSRIHLNTDSHIQVDFDDNTRAVKLIKGEAFFDVTKNQHKPFKINVGQREIQVLGTEFNVYKNGDKVSVTVTEGIVRVVESLVDDDPNEQLLTANTLGVFDVALSSISNISLSQMNDLLAWKQGVLRLQNKTLQELVDQLNRYREKKIVIQEAKIANLQISGVFDLHNGDEVISGLKLILPIRVRESNSKVLLFSKIQR